MSVGVRGTLHLPSPQMFADADLACFILEKEGRGGKGGDSNKLVPII